MIRLYFYVEGATEAGFAMRVLRPHLAEHGVMVMAAFEAATKRRRGEVHRGGGRRYLPARNELMARLKGNRGGDVRFTTLFDLYALYSDFPGTEAADKQKHIPYERVVTLEKAFKEDIDDSRLIPHIQLHEFEAMLFSEPDKFETIYANAGTGIEKLKAVAAKFKWPELIDDDEQTAPSKRIAAVFPQYAKAKPVDGVAIAEAISLQTIREKCPHFHRWLAVLEGLAAAGSGEEPI